MLSSRVEVLAAHHPVMGLKLRVMFSLSAQAQRGRLEEMTTESSSPSRFERVLAIAAVTIIGLAVLAFLVTLVLGLTDTGRETLATGAWPLAVWTSYVGLPVGFALIIVLLIVNNRRRAKDNPRDARR